MIDTIKLATNNMYFGCEGVMFSTNENNTPQLTLTDVEDNEFTFDAIKLAPVVMALISYEMWDVVYYINRIIKISNNVFELLKNEPCKDAMCVCVQKGIRIGNAEANLYSAMQEVQDTYGRDIFEIAMHLLEHENGLAFDSLADIRTFISDRA